MIAGEILDTKKSPGVVAPKKECKMQEVLAILTVPTNGSTVCYYLPAYPPFCPLERTLETLLISFSQNLAFRAIRHGTLHFDVF